MKIRFSTMFIKYSPYIPVILVGVFFHFLNFSKASFFYTDQASDFLIAQSILNNGHRPLVGPLLSAPGVYIPPTYYYLLALFITIGRTPIAVAFLFGIVNLFSMVGLMWITRTVAGRTSAILAGILFSITVVTQEHGRYMWQPHPVLWFETLMFVCFVQAYISKRVLWLYGALTSYVVAVSIYISPILLFPYVLQQSARLFMENDKQRKAVSLLQMMIFLVVICILIYLPQIIFETQNRYPTWHAITNSSSFSIHHSLSQLISLYGQNFLLFGEAVGNFSYVSSSMSKVIVCGFFLIVGLCGLALRKNRKPSHVFWHFFGSPWLFLSFLGLAIYNLDIYAWRLWFYLPFWIIALSVVIAFCLISKNIFLRVGGIILVSVYLIGNLTRFYIWTYKQALDTFDRSRKISSVIQTSMQKNAFDVPDVGIILFTANDEKNSVALPVMYFLHQEFNYPLSIMDDGNNIDTWSVVDSKQPVKYLICSEYNSIERILEKCKRRFLKKNPEYVQKENWLLEANVMVFLYSRQMVQF